MPAIGRRSFNATVAAAALGTVLRADEKKPSGKITLGFIGVGMMGRGHLGGFLGNPAVQVLAVSDVEPTRLQTAKKSVEARYTKDKAKGTWKGCAAYTDFRDLLARTPGALQVPCLGHCELAPVATAGDRVLPGGEERPVEHTTDDGPALGLGAVDETLADYERRGGLSLLREPPSRERILEELGAAGLVGYGGAGFPTAVKWEAVLRSGGEPVVAVNADEGEPGTFKDRYVMERRPHLLLEGTLVAMALAVS